jgi:hypothetical protein
MMFYMLLYYCTLFCIDVFCSWEKKKKTKKKKKLRQIYNCIFKVGYLILQKDDLSKK